MEATSLDPYPDDLVNPENRWRLETPRPKGWAKDVRPGGERDKYFIISCDNHLMPPVNMFAERIAPQYRDRLPRVELRDGVRWMVFETMRPAALMDFELHGEDYDRSKRGSDISLHGAHSDEIGLQRTLDQMRDGVDGELIFPNGLAAVMWASRDNDFIRAQCEVWNDWAWEVCGPYKDRCNPCAGLPADDIDASIREIERVAKMGYRVVCMPCRPIWGTPDALDRNYNHKDFNRLWAALQDHDLALTYHISSQQDPRMAKGPGGAVTNYVVHALAPTCEPIVNMCASGVFERFPKLRVATIEANAGWVPFVMQSMDEAYRKHHFWVRPKLKMLPSEYYRQNCYASFGEDEVAMHLMEIYGLEDNLMWANDYPHQEGSWPHSAEAIERTFGDRLSETTRAKVLGLNAARVFGFDIPKKYQKIG